MHVQNIFCLLLRYYDLEQLYLNRIPLHLLQKLLASSDASLAATLECAAKKLQRRRRRKESSGPVQSRPNAATRRRHLAVEHEVAQKALQGRRKIVGG
jgi:hypothetical protein